MVSPSVASYIPPNFANCPNEYRIDVDDKYLNCNIGNDSHHDWCQLLENLHRAKDFRRLFLAYVPLGLALVALAANALLAALSFGIFLKPFYAGKKRLLLLLSRSVACIIALLLLLAVLLAWRFGAFLYWSAFIFLTVGIAQFLAMAGTNLALSSLLYAAVLHPIAYRTGISMGRCWALIFAIWAFAIGASVPFGLFGATLFYPQTAPLNCPFGKCQWPVSLCLFLLLSLAYLLAIVCHVAMLWQMRARVRKVQPRALSNGSIESASTERHIRAMNRLSLNLVVFSLCKVPFVLISLVALCNLENLSQLGLGHKTPCKTFLHGALFFKVELLSSLAAIIWLIGMILDPTIDISLDPRFRQFLFSSLSRTKSILLRQQAKK